MGQEQRKPGELDKAIGARLRSRRKMLGLNQEVLAARCGISPQQYFKYERGISRISVARLIGFANEMQTPVSWFVAGLEAATDMPDDIARLIQDPDAIELLALFNSISEPHVRQAVRSLVRGAVTAAQEDQKRGVLRG